MVLQSLWESHGPMGPRGPAIWFNSQTLSILQLNRIYKVLRFQPSYKSEDVDLKHSNERKYNACSYVWLLFIICMSGFFLWWLRPEYHEVCFIHFVTFEDDEDDTWLANLVAIHLATSLNLIFKYIWTNCMSDNDKGCALVETKTSNDNIKSNKYNNHNFECLYFKFANHHICVVLWSSVWHIGGWNSPKIMRKSEYTYN
jgi:hypothetical protein